MLGANHFHNFSDLVYQRLGMYIEDKKKEVFQLKIQKAMRKKSIASYSDYFDIISNVNNTAEFQDFVNFITTNTTEFFREQNHFRYLVDHLDEIMAANPRMIRNQEIRIWCAGCSTGQEAYTLSMILHEHLNKAIHARILATDIDSDALSRAIKGTYSLNECEMLPANYKLKYMEKTDNGFKVSDAILQKITFRSFNLMDAFEFKKGFDIIFCRNVMIYFNAKVQQKLIDKFYEQLVPGGLFFIGHSESLVNKTHQYKNKAPSLYMK